MEDGVTAAVCLELAGKSNVPEAIRAYEKIRYPRVLATQRTGVTNRDNWHKAVKDFYEYITIRLLHEKSFKIAGINHVDITRE